MIIDNHLLVSGSFSGNTVTGQAVTGTGASILSTHTIDLSQARDIGEGEKIALRSTVITTVVGATSIEIQAITATNEAGNAGVLVVGSTGPIPLALLVAGARFVANLNPRVGSIGARYLLARYVIVGTGTAGAFVTDFGLETQDGQKAYPSAFSVV